MPSSVTTQVLPMLRSTVHPDWPVGTTGFTMRRGRLCGGKLETKLLRGLIPERDRDALQMERTAAGGVGSAEARATAPEPRRLDQLPVGVGEVIRPAIGIGEQL